MVLKCTNPWKKLNEKKSRLWFCFRPESSCVWMEHQCNLVLQITSPWHKEGMLPTGNMVWLVLDFFKFLFLPLRSCTIVKCQCPEPCRPTSESLHTAAKSQRNTKAESSEAESRGCASRVQHPKVNTSTAAWTEKGQREKQQKKVFFHWVFFFFLTEIIKPRHKTH